MDAKTKEEIVVTLATVVGGLTGVAILSPNPETRQMNGTMCTDILHIIGLILGDEADEIVGEAINIANSQLLAPFGIAIAAVRDPFVSTHPSTPPPPDIEMAAFREAAELMSRIQGEKGGT